MLTDLRFRLRSLLRRGAVEQELAEELREHLEHETQKYVDTGMSRSDAARRARVAMGGVEAVKEQCRDARGTRPLDELRQDIRYAFRLMRQTPGFTAAAILSLGLGIGATTTIFSLIDAVVLRSLPVARPHELFFLAHGEGDQPSTSSNYPLFERYGAATSVLSGVTAFRTIAMKVGLGDSVELVPGQYVSGNYHAVTGAPVILGRGFATESDRAPDGNPIAVVSERLWVRRFGRAPDVLGKTLTVQGRAVSIVGVTAVEFGGFLPGSPVDITLPLSMRVLDDPGMLHRHDGFTSMPLIARLRQGVSPEQALPVVNALFTQFMSEPENQWALKNSPSLYNVGRLLPAGKGGGSLRRRYSTPLFVLMGMVALVLLIASANVANLLLARSTARAREVAIRVCVGGGRARLVRQFMTEGAVLAAAGAAVGLLLSAWSTDAIVALFGTFQQPITLDVSPDVRVFAFTALVSLLAAAGFGLVPALTATRLELAAALKDGGPMHGTTPRRAGLGRALVSGQLALCLVMVVIAALLGRSVYNLRTRAAGFEPANVVLFSIDTFGTRIPRAQLDSHYRSLIERLRSLPEVITASASTSTPIHTSGQTRGLYLPWLPETPEARGVWVNLTTAEYLETMGVRLLRGRGFTAHDDAPGAPPVAIINETTARYVFGEADPVGRTIAFGRDPKRTEVIGVAQDAHQETLREAAPRMVYRPLMQEAELPGYVMIAMKVRPGNVNRDRAAASIRDIVRGVSPNLIVNHIRTLDEQIDASLVRERALTFLAAAFALLALLLACVGLYGVMSYNVARRTREFGIRIALGARRSEVLGSVIRESLAMSVAGIAMGLAGALLFTRVISTFLYGLSPRDPLTLAAVVAVLLLTTTAAAYLPARRAVTADPVRAMRTE